MHRLDGFDKRITDGENEADLYPEVIKLSAWRVRNRWPPPSGLRPPDR